MAQKTFKEKLQSGDAVHGAWVNLASTVSTEIIGRSGFDWLLIDLEHGPGDVAAMYQQLQVLRELPVTKLVRTDELTRPKTQRILDAGAEGIMFPRIDHPAEAELAVRCMYYPPKGDRGMARSVAPAGFGRKADEYHASVQKKIVTVVQIESIPALEQVDKIAAVPDVDVLFVGPTDLSLALGILGQINHATFQKALRDVAAATKKHGKCAGILLRDPSEYEMYFNHGFRFIACGGDGQFVAKGADEMAKALSSELQKRK